MDNTNEMIASIEMILARLKSNPNTFSEWSTIQYALKKCVVFVARQMMITK